MDNSSPPRAGIIGAGIAGLASAIALRRAGWQVEVFERSSFRSEVGAAITVSPNATRVLDRWGFDYETARPVEHQRLTYQLAADLSVIVDEDFSDAPQKFGTQCWAFHRVDLHQGLLTAAKMKQQGEEVANLRLTTEVVGLEPEGGVIILKDGTRIEKDLVIVADGAHSDLVESITGQKEQLKSTGRSTFRCLIPREKVNQNPDVKALIDNPLTGMTVILDPATGTLCVIYLCRGGSVVNVSVVHATQKHVKITDDWSSPASMTDVLKATGGFHPTVMKLLNMADDIRVYHLMYRESLERFTRGKALAIGDAAHPMLPLQAAGGGITIESAASLEPLFSLDSLSASQPLSAFVSERLHIFDTIRLPRCNLIQILSNCGHGRHADPEVVKSIRRFYAGPLPPKEAMTWSVPFRQLIFSYDVYKEVDLELGKAPKAGFRKVDQSIRVA